MRAVVAVVGLLVANAAVASPHNGEAGHGAKSEPNQQPALPQRLIEYQDARQAGGYRVDCTKPVERDDSDLCVQWGAVEGVREANALGWQQLRWTVAEFAALVATLFATAFAAWAAAKAARAADRAVEVTERSSRQQLRAYLCIEAAALKDRFTPVFKIRNAGQTPAYRITIEQSGIVAERHEHINWNSYNHIVTKEFFLGPGMDATVVPSVDVSHYVAGLTTGRCVIFHFGKITYYDAFDQERSTGFRTRWEMDEKVGTLTMGLCEEGNYGT